MHEAKLGDRVRIEYSRVPKPGAMVVNPRAPKALEFTVGSSDIIPSISLGVVGMAQGDRKRLAFRPETENGIVPGGLGKQTPLQRSRKRYSLRVRQPRAAHSPSDPPAPIITDSTATPVVVELDVMLVSLDSSASANKQKPQFEMGGEG